MRHKARNTLPLMTLIRPIHNDYKAGIHGGKAHHSRNATDCTPATSNRLRQRMFLHITMSSRRTM